MNAVETAQHELLNFTNERDSTITNLKDSLLRMEYVMVLCNIALHGFL